MWLVFIFFLKKKKIHTHKQDLALINQQGLICYKNFQPTNDASKSLSLERLEHYDISKIVSKFCCYQILYMHIYARK